MEGDHRCKLSSPYPSLYGSIIIFYVASLFLMIQSLFQRQSTIVILAAIGYHYFVSNRRLRACSLCHSPANLLPGSLCVQTYELTLHIALHARLHVRFVHVHKALDVLFYYYKVIFSKSWRQQQITTMTGNLNFVNLCEGMTKDNNFLLTVSSSVF